MDRHEAVLRELNLYPLWVRRDTAVSIEVNKVQTLPGQVAVVENHPHPQSLVKLPANRLSPQADKSLVVPQREREVEPFSPRGTGWEGGEVSWSELKSTVQACQACKLRAGCTQTVFGVGDEKADWLFVGEGPGADEDAQGEPFVGQAGKLLDNMLMAIKLKRGSKVYIANVVKCRPPGNRVPEPDEVATCMPYLQQQIALIQPKVIVALGKTAANALLKNSATLGSMRGTLHHYNRIPLIVTYHPAYLLRSPSEKAKAWQDLCVAQKIIQGAE